MPKPAFPQEQVSRAWFDHHEGLKLLRRIRTPSRRCHHEGKARVLEANRAGAFRYLDVERAGNNAVRVNMAAVLSATFKDINPKAVQTGLLRKVECAFGSEFRCVRSEDFHEVREGWIALRKIVERGIASVARIAVLPAPAASGKVVLREGTDRVRKIAKLVRPQQLY